MTTDTEMMSQEIAHRYRQLRRAEFELSPPPWIDGTVIICPAIHAYRAAVRAALEAEANYEGWTFR